MTLEKISDLVGFLIGPPRLFPRLLAFLRRRLGLSGGIDARAGPRSCELRKETVGEKHSEDDQSEIGFQERRPRGLEKERVSLQESHDRIDQICDKIERQKDDDCARHVDDGKYNRERGLSAKRSLFRSGKTMIPQAAGSIRPAFQLLLDPPRARSSEERVCPPATFLTMPPFRPVNPACCEP